MGVMPRTDWVARSIQLESIIARVDPAPTRVTPPCLDEFHRAKPAEAIVFGENSAEWHFLRQDDRSKTNVTAKVLGTIIPSTLAVVSTLSGELSTTLKTITTKTTHILTRLGWCRKGERRGRQRKEGNTNNSQERTHYEN